MRIAIVAPACPLPADVPDRVIAAARAYFGKDAPELVFHPQCFLESGHFAGDDAQRADALIAVANDPAFDAVWFARGGYGSNRIADAVLPRLGRAARSKFWLGYSDMGFLLAGLYRHGIGRPVHAPMPADIRRAGGEAAILRTLGWLKAPQPAADAPCAAFNMTVLAALIGTPLEPDLSGHVLMLEEVDEHHYRIDRLLFQITSHLPFRALAGLRLGRCAPVPENDRPFGADEASIAHDWCARAGVPYLGRANIGHDADNDVVPFG